MSNFKLVGKIDICGLSTELNNNNNLWGQLPYRTTFKGSPHVDVSDIWIRYPDVKKYTQSAKGIQDIMFSKVL